VSVLWARTWGAPDFNRTALTDFNTDLFPKDEYDLASRRP
jgi:hypothetical protein